MADHPDLSINSQLGSTTPVNKPSFSLADMTPSGISPEMALNWPQDSRRLQFPSDIGSFYTTLALAKYTRATWNAVGTLTTEKLIVLPLPSLIIENQRILYEEVETKAAGAALNAWAGKTGILETATGQAISTAAKIGGTAGAAGLGYVGIAINNFLTVMLKSPSYKILDYVWHFAPRSEKESQEL